MARCIFGKASQTSFAGEVKWLIVLLKCLTDEILGRQKCPKIIRMALAVMTLWEAEMVNVFGKLRRGHF